MKNFKAFLEDSSPEERLKRRQDNVSSAKSELDAREKTSQSFTWDSKLKAQYKRKVAQDAFAAVKEKYRKIYPNLKK